jgi:hypothetical protein
MEDLPDKVVPYMNENTKGTQILLAGWLEKDFE